MRLQKEGILSGKIIGCAMEVHRQLGPGLLESIYEECLCYELSVAKLKFERQKQIIIDYKGTRLANNLKLDLLVNSAVIVELKATKN